MYLVKKIRYCIILILIISLIATTIPNAVSDEISRKPITENGNLTFSIWDYTNTLNEPNKAMVIEFEHKQWQVLSAISFVPAFINRDGKTPIFFADTNSDVSTIIPNEGAKITSFGSDATSVSAKIAADYWSKAELVFIVENYEHALWIVPSASFFGAPILVSPTQDTINTLNTRCAVIVGNSNIEVEESIILSDHEDVWGFQLDLFKTKGEMCNYIILTNPRDTEDTTPENIKWTYQSPAAAILGAYRQALILTGDWSMDRKAFEKVESTSSPDQTNYDKIKPSFTQLKDDSYNAIKILKASGNDPEYLTAVGGPYSVPNYVYDIHVDYKYPIGSPAKTQYPSSLAAYATISETVDATKYTKEDLASGRIAGGNIFDITKQLIRTLFYREYLPGGNYNENTRFGWEKSSCIVDGHRLNQPEPNNLIWNPSVPYYPYEGVNSAYSEAGLTVDYYLPRNESDPYDTNMTIEKIMETTTDYGFFHFMPHGGMTNLRIEVGNDNLTGRQNVFLEAATISELEYDAPTIVYTTCCKGGVWMFDTGYKPEDFITSSFIHAGAVVYIATPEIQSTCFWDEAPKGTATEQAVKFWELALSDNVPIGKAFKDAKWQIFQFWDSKTPKPASIKTHHVDSLSYTLFGDPALELYKPNVPFKESKELDLEVKLDDIYTDSEFTVTVSVTDLRSGNTISDATIELTFNGAKKSGTTITFQAPKETGEKELKVTVTKSGYESVSAVSMVQVMEDDENGDNGQGFIPGFGSILIVTAVAIILIFLIYGSMKKIEKNK